MANGTKKKSRKKLYIFGGLGVLVLALIIMVFLGGSKEEIIAVQVEDVNKRDITQTVAATGNIDPEFKVLITPEVTGEIVTLPVKEGERVKKGQLLVKIKPDLYIAQKERADASLSSAKSTLAMRKAELDKVESDYSRIKELHAKNLASDSELEASKSTFLSMSASYQGAEANVAQMAASLREANEQLYKTTIYSPMDGTVSQLNVELGERVLGSGFSQGTNIMTVSDLGNMEAVVDVDENDVVLVSIGDTAKIKVDAFGDKEFIGTVTEIGNSAKTSGAGTQELVVNFSVRIKLIDPDNKLRPGMSCNADIETETHSNVISVPIQSVTARTDFTPSAAGEEEEGNSAPRGKGEKPKEIVFIIEDNKAKSVEVKTGISDDNYIEVTSGLNGGEKVVSGSYRAISRELSDGSNVKVEDNSKGKPQYAENQ
ncbi:MAG: efflux RND transporter periplasmic adaptor subunit [Ignavibacteriaceae bacterium]